MTGGNWYGDASALLIVALVSSRLAAILNMDAGHGMRCNRSDLLGICGLAAATGALFATRSIGGSACTGRVSGTPRVSEAEVRVVGAANRAASASVVISERVDFSTWSTSGTRAF